MEGRRTAAPRRGSAGAAPAAGQAADTASASGGSALQTRVRSLESEPTPAAAAVSARIAVLMPNPIQ